tara:strand:+ start:411 stop:1295 length:885 start_codon:yes stop_codon:yes gene_type:complete
MFFPRYADIETVSHCNARCVYCPQSISPKSANTMDMFLFETILKKIRHEYNISSDFNVVLNHYGEPLLDKHFLARIDIIRLYSMRVGLFTNATLLTDRIIDFLEEGDFSRNMGVTFNFPEFDPDKWCKTMQLPKASYIKALNGITKFIKKFANKDFPITLSDKLKDKLEIPNCNNIVFMNFIPDTRADNIPINEDNKKWVWKDFYKNSTYINGCMKPTLLHILSVGYNGDVYLCCQDYHQKYNLGNVGKENIHDIMTSDKANNLRDQIYGKIPADEDLLCRNCNLSVVDFSISS